MVEPFVNVLKGYGLWPILALAFLVFGVKHIAPILTAIGSFLNERHKANLLHERSMAKLRNKIEHDNKERNDE